MRPDISKGPITKIIVIPGLRGISGILCPKNLEIPRRLGMTTIDIFQRPIAVLICVLFIASSIGCGTAAVRPYVGEQQAWPTASGSIVITKYKLPIFTSLPPTSYEVIGELTLEQGIVVQPDVDRVPILVNKAVQLGADALLFVNGNQFFGKDYGPRKTEPATGADKPGMNIVGTFDPTSFQAGVSVVAIRWVHEPPPGLRRR